MNINDTLRYQNIGLPEDVQFKKAAGDFKGAIRLIDLRLQEDNLPKVLRAGLQVQREILLRLPEEFPYTKEQALKIVQEKIADFTAEELDTYIDQRKIRWIYIDGQVHIFNRFFNSLCKTEADFRQRAGVTLPGVESAVNGTVEAGLLDISMKKMKEQGSMSNRFRIRATLKVKDEVFKPGIFVRAHLPIPSNCQQQSDIVIETMYPENGNVAPEDALQRTVCWEEYMQENHEFIVEYSYTHTAKYTEAYAPENCPLSAGELNVCLEQPTELDLAEQEPHIVFTPYIRDLCDELTEGMTEPLDKARAFYDFITINMKYTFMPSYFVLENIAESCARNYNGDCGVFALLFLTMCRYAGIPAQWQSGLTAEPDFCGGHDWVRFYVEPYGWIFADPSYGTGAVRLGKEERRQFYFGNLDPYRLVCNSAFAAPFTVEKQQWRADPYDNQLGEMETDEKGLLFDEYIRTKEILLCEEI